MKSPEQVYECWAPEGALWSPWVKPVLFTELTAPMLQAGTGETPRAPDWPWLPFAGSGTALVLDLAGADALRLSVALTGRGYRPVPLFNGVPGPGGGAFVPVGEIGSLLVTLADDVARADLPAAAPPAFVLDAGRMAGGRVPPPGQFDNRWMVFPQDLPSASFLREHGLQRVVVVQASGSAPSDDLAHSLRGYRRGGVETLVKPLDDDGEPRPAAVVGGPWLRTVLFRALVLMRLRRSSTGGFGAKVPEPSRSGFVG